MGHLRNAALGDTLCRLLRFQGTSVEVQNYIDDTGVQVADVVVGFCQLAHKPLEEIRQLAATPGFDYYCWDLYTKVASFYDTSPENRKLRDQTLREIEADEGETAAIARHVSQTIVQCHLATMSRLGVAYDLLPKESDILQLNFWSHAFELLYVSQNVVSGCRGTRAGYS